MEVANGHCYNILERYGGLNGAISRGVIVGSHFFMFYGAKITNKADQRNGVQNFRKFKTKLLI